MLHFLGCKKFVQIDKKEGCQLINLLILTQFGAWLNGLLIHECKFSFLESDERHMLIGSGAAKITTLKHVSRDKFTGTQTRLKVDPISVKAFSYKPEKFVSHF